MQSRIYSILLLALCTGLGTPGCKKKPPAPVSQESASAPESVGPQEPVISYKNPPSITLAPPNLTVAPVKSSPLDLVTVPFDGKIALQRARTICDMGSRAYGTPGHQQALNYLRSEMTRLGWKIIEQTFEIPTLSGPRTYHNLIARWPGPTSENKPDVGARIVFAAHYDAPATSASPFPQASAGAAGCGLLLEMAERLKIAPDRAAHVEFVFFDGEEPIRQITETDGLLGSRFFIHSLEENGQLPNIRALLGFGAVGHRSAHWTIPTLTSLEVNQALQTKVIVEKWVDQIAPLDRPVWGPHLPALQAGISAGYLHDASYPALGTADDNASQLDAESLRRAGVTALQLLNLPNTSAVGTKPK